MDSKYTRDQLASDEEWYFCLWCQELKQAGYIKDYFKITEPKILTEGLDITYIKKMKKVPDKILTQTILEPSEYTPDFKVEWNNNALKIFFQILFNQIPNDKIITPFIAQGFDNTSIVEIKADFDKNNMTRLVRNNIKVIYDKYNIYVNLIKIPSLFKKTFTPKRYLITNKTNKPRTIKFPVKTLQEYVKERQNI